MSALNYDKQGRPFVWVVKKEYGIDVYFEYENAKRGFFDEYKRIKSIESRDELTPLCEDTDDERPSAGWVDRDGQILCIYVNTADVLDATIQVKNTK